jgi:hypothetical protein
LQKKKKIRQRHSRKVQIISFFHSGNEKVLPCN